MFLNICTQLLRLDWFPGSKDGPAQPRLSIRGDLRDGLKTTDFCSQFGIQQHCLNGRPGAAFERG
jgi:hypothetical protein